ncbi:DarT ssDNA thymidine ADP-ribosyltransferase family protein [Curtobacterium ammoniigenes]|uniref:DarT ssDNA thymidine ADP-ribosyltransferase family protein n=1 Tax=Curtobacterium ammoniigenes TaxID=395387 RepID=UPI00082CF307|nr:DarT ssDNA thymidine ADP-ribosyltransferase family protein [Curtobacterium ammoniigenes]
MTDECIHGFPTELCDICSPRRPAEPAATPAPTPRRPRATSSLRSPSGPAAGTASSAASRGGSRKPESPAAAARAFASLRAHHFTHIDNLPAIVAAGALLPRSAAAPSIDVASVELVGARRNVTVPEGTAVIDYVPFALTPDALAWEAVRSGADSPLWSDAARASRATDFVILVVPTTAFDDAVALADGNAIDPGVRFATGREAVGSLLRRARLTDPELQSVELLSATPVPLSSVAVVGVANERSREVARRTLAAAGATPPRVAVFPPWFVPATAV